MMNQMKLYHKEDDQGIRHSFTLKYLSVPAIKILLGSLEKQYTIVLDILSNEITDVNIDYKTYNDQMIDILDLINTLSQYDK